MLHVSFRLLTRKTIMDIIYTVNQLGFGVDDFTESKDLLYWYSAYQKDREKAKTEKQKHTNKVVVRR